MQFIRKLIKTARRDAIEYGLIAALIAVPPLPPCRASAPASIDLHQCRLRNRLIRSKAARFRRLWPDRRKLPGSQRRRREEMWTSAAERERGDRKCSSFAS